MSSGRALPSALLALGALLAALASGCPSKSGDGADITSEVPTSGKLVKPSRPPLAQAPSPSPVVDDPNFPRVALFEVYRAEMLLPDSDRHAVFVRNGLESGGKPVASRVQAYEDALKRFASDHPDEWSAFADEVEAQRDHRGSLREPASGVRPEPSKTGPATSPVHVSREKDSPKDEQKRQ